MKQVFLEYLMPCPHVTGVRYQVLCFVSEKLRFLSKLGGIAKHIAFRPDIGEMLFYLLRSKLGGTAE